MQVIEVTLPTMEVVEVPVDIDGDWFTHRKTGYLNPKLLAPYAKQPRLFMHPVKLQELGASVASQGVRDPIILTPVHKAPWATFHEGDKDLPFLIVSGHRRHQTALSAELEAVPVEIRIYANESEFNADAEVLNDHRQNLSELEDGYRLRREYEGGTKIAAISRRDGRTAKYVNDRIYMTYLCPTILAKVSPELRRQERLATGFASALGSLGLARKFQFDNEYSFEEKLKELGDTEPFSLDLSDDEKRFRVQRAYFAYCSKKGWKGTVSEKFVRTGEYPSTGTGRSNGAIEKAAGPPKEVKGLRMRLIDWFMELNAMDLLDMDKVKLDRFFSNAVRRDLEIMADRLGIAAAVLRDIASRKTEYSEEALRGQRRPEQKIFKDD